MHEFIEYLNKNKDNTSIMSAFRDGLRKATQDRAWKHIALFCNLNNPQAVVFQTVGAFYAMHPVNVDSKSPQNFGDVMKRLGQKYPTFERRFERMLSRRTYSQICSDIESVINVVKVNNIPVNYDRLLWDLLKWEKNDIVKRSWANHFWREAE